MGFDGLKESDTKSVYSFIEFRAVYSFIEFRGVHIGKEGGIELNSSLDPTICRSLPLLGDYCIPPPRNPV